MLYVPPMQESEMNALTENIDISMPTTPILFSDSAATKVAQLIEEEGNPI